MQHQIIKPNYAYNALEPYIDAATMELHTEKHHQGYADKLNAALESRPDLQNKSLEELVSLGTNDQPLVTNMAGGVLNHNFFWNILSPQLDQPVPEPLNSAITAAFGKFESFKSDFSDQATKLFGSGWTWLVLPRRSEDEGGSVQIVSTPNQACPYRDWETDRKSVV